MRELVHVAVEPESGRRPAASKKERQARHTRRERVPARGRAWYRRRAVGGGLATREDEYEIVRLQVDEVARLKALRLAALKDSPSAFGTTLQEAEGWSDSSWLEQLRRLATFVCVSGGSDCGVVRGTREGDAAWLISMWVAPGMRGRGVAVALGKTVVNWARASGATRLLLDVTEGNAAAVATYRRLGFEPTGEAGTLPSPREHLKEHRFELRL